MGYVHLHNTELTSTAQTHTRRGQSESTDLFVLSSDLHLSAFCISLTVYSLLPRHIKKKKETNHHAQGLMSATNENVKESKEQGRRRTTTRLSSLTFSFFLSLFFFSILPVSSLLALLSSAQLLTRNSPPLLSLGREWRNDTEVGAARFAVELTRL